MTGIAEVVYKRGQGHSPLILDSADAIDDVLEELGTDAEPGGVSHNLAQVYSLKRDRLASGYPDHELLVGVDGERGVGLMSFMDGSVGNVVTIGTFGTLHSEYFIAGNITEFDGEKPMELPVDELRLALREFIANGEIPSSVQWQTLL